MKYWHGSKTRKLVIVACLIITIPAFAVADDEGELAKASQNPVGDIISLPLEYWHYDEMANSGSADAIMLKPVYPFHFPIFSQLQSGRWLVSDLDPRLSPRTGKEPVAISGRFLLGVVSASSIDLANCRSISSCRHSAI